MNFDELPEGCIAKAISLTTPADACRLSVVSPGFRSAADSDTVWNEFLPSDYASTVSRSHGPSNLMSLPSKKQLFFSLCNDPILIDGGSKSFWLDKWSGKKCYMIAARDLMIAWGGTPTYWSWINLPDSRFNEVAELRYVWWLEIRGKIDTSQLSPATTYTAFLVFKIGDEATDLGVYPTKVSAGVVGGTMSKSTVCLDPRFGDASEARRRLPRPWYAPRVNNRVSGLKCPTRRNDGWLEIELGEYFNGIAEEEGEILEMSLMEVKACKSGLIVQGIEIRPKSGFLVLLCSGPALSIRVLLDQAVRQDTTMPDGQMEDGLEWFLLGTVPGGLGNCHDIVVKRLQPIRPPKKGMSESEKTDAQSPIPEFDAPGHQHGAASVSVRPVPNVAKSTMSKLAQTNALPPMPEVDADGNEHSNAGMRVFLDQAVQQDQTMPDGQMEDGLEWFLLGTVPGGLSNCHDMVVKRLQPIRPPKKAMSESGQTDAQPPVLEFDASGYQHGTAGMRVSPVPNMANSGMSKFAQIDALPRIPEDDSHGY